MIVLERIETGVRIDLHLHTTASDGQYRPETVARMCIMNNIDIMAISDHDTLEGIESAKVEAEKGGIRFVPGIEISTQDIEEIHILGYEIDITNEALTSACFKWHRDREDRANRIVDYLATKGIPVEIDCVKQYSNGGNIGRPHFARYLIDHGFVSNREEAFSVFLDTDEFWEATDRIKPSSDEAIKLIHDAGGKAVLAHPGIYSMNEIDLDKLIERLTIAGIDGIECFYSKHNASQTDHYLKLMRYYNLKTSCGSDFHGDRIKPGICMGIEFDYKRYGKDLVTNCI